MNNKTIIKGLLGISIILIILFIFFTITDYIKYNDSYSAPFYVYILLRAVEFIIPSITSAMIAHVLKKRSNKE